MVSVIVLRKKHKALERPFKVPFYPIPPVLALVIAVVAFVSITFYNPVLAILYFSILALSYAWFRIMTRKNSPLINPSTKNKTV